MSGPLAYIFDAPVQRLRANDRVIRCSEPELYGETVLYVESSRHREGTAPTPYSPVRVTTTGPRDKPPAAVPWGTRIIIERIPDPTEDYHVSALEPVTDTTRLTVQVLSELEVPSEEYGRELTYGEPAAGAIVAELLRADGGEILLAAPREGEAIGAWWYVDGHRLETPAEHSARDAADLFADHTVRLRPSGCDAGETCRVCGRVISWTDHLPPAKPGELVRCMTALGRANARSVI